MNLHYAVFYNGSDGTPHMEAGWPSMEAVSRFMVFLIDHKLTDGRHPETRAYVGQVCPW